MWLTVDKGNNTVRGLADRHYTRQSPGAKMFTRPGFSFVLVCKCGHSGWVWWRPKWEDGRPGTARKDGLKSIECTLFRREASCSCGQASDLIIEAKEMLSTDDAHYWLHFYEMGPLDKEMPLLTAIGVAQTQGRRSKKAGLVSVIERLAGSMQTLSAVRL